MPQTKKLFEVVKYEYPVGGGVIASNIGVVSGKAILNGGGSGSGMVLPYLREWVTEAETGYGVFHMGRKYDWHITRIQ